ncbi:MAG: DM13 domain-containing protein [Gammaproteobacteria bacterium]|nr:DM13 domain-containing protein [Gammaproteobacteria bacterium]
MKNTMKKLGLLLGILLAILLIGFVSLHFSKPQLRTEKEEAVLTALQNPSTFTKMLSGEFDPKAIGSDDLHRGSGKVYWVEKDDSRYLVFDEDFQVTRGPDYKVYLVPDHNIHHKELFKNIKNQATRLGNVSQFSGKQVFTIPETYHKPEKLGVVIWCETFKQFISYANLQP